MVYKIVLVVVQQALYLFAPPAQLTQTKCNTPAVAKTTTDKVLITFISSRKVSTKRGGRRQKLDEKGGVGAEGG